MLRAILLVLYTLGAALALVMAGLAVVSIVLLVEAIRGHAPGPGAATIVLAFVYCLAMLYVARRMLAEVRTGFRGQRPRRSAVRVRPPAPLPRARIVPR